jgi:hypothetical protein
MATKIQKKDEPNRRVTDENKRKKKRAERQSRE